MKLLSFVNHDVFLGYTAWKISCHVNITFLPPADFLMSSQAFLWLFQGLAMHLQWKRMHKQPFLMCITIFPLYVKCHGLVDKMYPLMLGTSIITPSANVKAHDMDGKNFCF